MKRSEDKKAPARKTGLINRLRGKAGETISETLVSLLIGVLALVMLAGAVTAASRAIRRGRTKMSDYYDAGEEVAQMPGDGTEAAAVFSDGERIAVSLFENSEISGTRVISYKIKALEP